MNNIRKTLLKVGIVSTSVLMGVMLTATEITDLNRVQISQALGQPTFVVEQKEGTEGQVVDTQYYKTKYKNLSEVFAAGRNLAEKIEGEGAVLLENNKINETEKALPLAKGSKISLFGVAGEAPSYGGRGSAQGGATKQDPVDFETGLKNAGFEVNGKLASFYDGKKGDEINYSEIAEDASLVNSFAEYNTAVYVLTRTSGEGKDMLTTNPGDAAGESVQSQSLYLTKNEKSILSNLAALKNAGKISKIVVVLNTINQIQQDQFLPEYKIDATLLAGHIGITGANAIGKILCGDINPSGHLPDTFYQDHTKNIVYANSNVYDYQGMDKFPGFTDGTLPPAAFGNWYQKYFAYQEGIYVGYRYTETRYTDKVNKVDGVGDFEYNDVVYRPFGYGESYTDFEYSNFGVTPLNEETIQVSVDVKNIGAVAGKDAVQIYLQKPYTDFDKTNGIEKAAVELVGYAKTKTINPSETINVTIDVDRENLKSYDAKVEKTYIVTPGQYGLTAAKDAHAAANNFLTANGKKVTDGMTEKGNAELVYQFNEELDRATYSQSLATGKKITNLFDEYDINTFSGKDDANKGVTNKLDFYSRSNWSKTIDNKISMTQGIFDNFVRQKDSSFITSMQNQDDKYPTYGPDVDGGTHPIPLITLYKDAEGNLIDYDDPAWDALLDQLTWEETVEIIRIGARKTNGLPSISKPETTDHNGPCGFTELYTQFDGLAKKNNDPLKDSTPVYFPSIPVLTATFSHEIAAEYGDFLGEDSLWTGVAGFYGIGLNTHRSPFAGRRFEYYSEDPFLAGTISAKQVEMLQSHGCNAYIKHFALNDQEQNRNNVSIWSNEQALREISFRSFELCVRKGGAMNAMASFTRIGSQMVPGCKALLTDFLRGEVGMKGLVVSDMWFMGYKNEMLPGFVAAGCDIPDGTVPLEIYEPFKENHPTFANQLREAAHRVLFSTVRSHAMNGFDTNTVVRQVTPAWESLRNGVTYASIALFAAVMAWTVTEITIYFVKSKKSK